MDLTELWACKLDELKQYLDFNRVGSFPVPDGLREQAAEEILRRAETGSNVSEDVVLRARAKLGR